MKKITSIRVHPAIWKAAKLKALQNDIVVSVYIERLIEKDLNIV